MLPLQLMLLLDLWNLLAMVLEVIYLPLFGVPKIQKLFGLNASGRSPKNLTLDYFLENNYSKIPAYGPLPVSVPGCVDGWFELHERFGSLEMQKLLEPAISYAENGFPVTELVAHYMQLSSKRFRLYPNFHRDLLH